MQINSSSEQYFLLIILKVGHALPGIHTHVSLISPLMWLGFLIFFQSIMCQKIMECHFHNYVIM
jgi:hypothetical protein